MKKLLLIGFSLFSICAFAQSINFGIKAGMVYNADKGMIRETNNLFKEKGKGSVGFQAGAMLRIKAASFYVQPELLYTNYKNEFEENGESIDIKKNRLDLPINVGKTFALGLVQIQTGPVFSMNFEDKIKGVDLPDADKRDKMSLGWQIGTGLNIKKLNIDLRYEFGLGKTTSRYLLDAVGTTQEFKTENRASMLNLSIGYFL